VSSKKNKPSKTKSFLFQPLKLGIGFSWFQKNYLPILLFLTLLVLSFITFEGIFENKYFPRTYIGDTNVTFLTKSQALQILQDKFTKRSSSKLQFFSQGQAFDIDLLKSNSRIDFSSLDQLFAKSHSSSLGQRFAEQLKTLVLSERVSPKVEFNIDEQMEKNATNVYQTPIDAQLIYDETTNQEGSPSANIQIKESVPGIELDRNLLELQVKNYLIFGSYHQDLPLKVAQPKVATVHLQKAKLTLENLVNNPIQLRYEGNLWLLDSKQLLTLLDLTEGKSLLDEKKVKIYLEKIAQEVNREVKEGRFEFNSSTNRVTTFEASQEGRRLDLNATNSLIVKALEDPINRNIGLPVEVVKPKVNTSEINNLGIKELIGQGISHFAGSIPNRIYNIGLTASKLNGTLVAPGDTFSFNNTVGDISAATGFKQAYIIKEGRTVLDDGGGVCQDSTTLFRAVLNAGLPIVKRTAHAYRVGYYEQGFAPGLDATVYYPSVDFQFKNDTPSHILIQAYTLGTTLYIDLYGTHDGRTVTLTNPVISSQTPPPPEIRQDDPSLPKGEIKQVDWAAWGANVSFKRTVTKNGETLINETWRSNYRPWQAVYLIGTKE